MLSEGGPLSSVSTAGSISPLKLLTLSTHPSWKKTTKLIFSIGLRELRSVPGIFTKVQEIIRLFTVSDCITVGVVCVCVLGGG